VSPKFTPIQNARRKVAICYVRLSYSRVKDDSNSPERQKANIETICQRNGWTCEWYTDTVGHKSGRTEKNRPGWLAAKARLSDPDVVALVANDFARLHRKLARMSDLLDQCDESGVRLVQAAPGRDFDTSTNSGHMLAQFIALQDESYANDVSIRQIDNTRYVNEQGKLNGLPPFGTVRNEEGFLKRDRRGVWWLPNGKWSLAEKSSMPEPGAQWRPYDRCALRMLILYCSGRIGYKKIAARMNETGWAFRDRWGNPRQLSTDDVRRTLSNWPEYGGTVVQRREEDQSSKNRSPHHYPLDTITLKPQRAVFPVRMLRKVGEIRLAREVRKPDHGLGRKAHAYPLNEITFCAHCARRAIEQKDLKLRSRLTGNTQGKKVRYRHKLSIRCGCVNRSVHCATYEEDFRQLLLLLNASETELKLMNQASLQTEGVDRQAELRELATKKAESIALCRRRIEAAINLYGEGRISHADYAQRVEANEREIETWEASTTDVEQELRDLVRCHEIMTRLTSSWETSTNAERQKLASAVFSEILYNLDTRRIEGFTLKPSMERYLMLRASLYTETTKNVDTKAFVLPESVFQSHAQDVIRQGYRAIFRDSLHTAISLFKSLLYPLPRILALPASAKIPPNIDRNREIYSRYLAGERAQKLADEFGISVWRVNWLINRFAQTRFDTSSIGFNLTVYLKADR
jgi:DNA invertase Pin-like site-specific DNA recombinase